MLTWILGCTTAALAVSLTGCAIQLILSNKKKGVNNERLDAMFDIVKKQADYYEQRGDDKQKELADAYGKSVELERAAYDSEKKRCNDEIERLKNDNDAEISKLEAQLDKEKEKASKDIEKLKAEINQLSEKLKKKDDKNSADSMQNNEKDEEIAGLRENIGKLNNELTKVLDKHFLFKREISQVNESLKKAMSGESEDYLKEEIVSAVSKITEALKNN